MARPVEHDDTKFLDRLLESLGEFGQVVADRGVNVDRTSTPWANGNLVHVETGAGIKHGSLFRERNHRERAITAHCRQGGAVNGVDGNVYRGGIAIANEFSVIEHRGIIFLALADDHNALHLDAT